MYVGVGATTVDTAELVVDGDCAELKLVVDTEEMVEIPGELTETEEMMEPPCELEEDVADEVRLGERMLEEPTLLVDGADPDVELETWTLLGCARMVEDVREDDTEETGAWPGVTRTA